jgi:hypothetical protein
VREEQLNELTQKIVLLNQNPPPSTETALLDDIHDLQKKIVEGNKKINEITKPIKETKLAHLTGNENLAKSYTNLAISSAGVVLSVIALLLIIGTVAAPPFVLPVVVGFGIGMAAFGIIKWAAEKYADMEDVENQAKKDEAQEDSILNEALDSYQKQQNRELGVSGNCSYSKHMDGLLKTIVAPQEPQSSPPVVSPDSEKTPKDVPVPSLEEDRHDKSHTQSSGSGVIKP